MKIILIIILALQLHSCNVKYNGLIYDFDTEKPIQGVNILSKDSLLHAISNKNGYFEIKLKDKVREFIFKKNGYRTHHLKTLSIQNGELMRELPFGDTIYLISTKSKYSRPKTE